MPQDLLVTHPTKMASLLGDARLVQTADLKYSAGQRVYAAAEAFF